MSITMPPSDSTAAPARIDIEPREITVTGVYENGASHQMNLIENQDIPVLMGAGRERRCQLIPWDVETGHVVLALGVDDDHDEVHYATGASGVDADELLGQAIEVLTACRTAARRVRTA